MVYNILPELKAKENLSDLYFVNKNLPDERVEILLSDKELNKLPENSPNVLKKSNINLYVERPGATFYNGKYSVLNDFCYAKILACYTRKNKSSNSCECQPDELNDSLIEKNHESSYPKQMKFMISREGMRCRNVRRILQYHVPNKILYPEKSSDHVLLLFYPFRDEKELLLGLPPLHQNKSQEQRVQDIENINKLNHVVI